MIDNFFFLVSLTLTFIRRHTEWGMQIKVVVSSSFDFLLPLLKVSTSVRFLSSRVRTIGTFSLRGRTCPSLELGLRSIIDREEGDDEQQQEFRNVPAVSFLLLPPGRQMAFVRNSTKQLLRVLLVPPSKAGSIIIILLDTTNRTSSVASTASLRRKAFDFFSFLHTKQPYWF